LNESYANLSFLKDGDGVTENLKDLRSTIFKAVAINFQTEEVYSSWNVS
jgi:hypothetical protein